MNTAIAVDRVGPRVPGESARTVRRVLPATVLAVLAVALGAVAILAIATGGFPIGPAQVLAILLAQTGMGPVVTFSPEQEAVLMTIRLPRVLLAILVGGGLALAGAAMQGLFRNPLADPTLIGVSSGAALAAATVIVMGAVWLPGLTKVLGHFTLPLAAFGGGLAAAAFVYRLGAVESRTSLGVMLLAGIAVTSITEAAIGFFTYVANDEQLRNLAFWRLGSLNAASWSVLAVVAPLVLAAAAALLGAAAPLNAIALGEAEAGHVGVDVQRLKRMVIVATALAVGALVSVSGQIFFVGLLAPHMVRLLCGPNHRLLLPASVLSGALLVLLADIVARTVVMPAELPIGVITAILGGPFFLALLLRERRAIRL